MAGCAVCAQGGSNTTLKRCTFAHNEIGVQMSGVGTNGRVTDCKFEQNFEVLQSPTVCPRAPLRARMPVCPRAPPCACVPKSSTVCLWLKYGMVRAGQLED